MILMNQQVFSSDLVSIDVVDAFLLAPHESVY